MKVILNVCKVNPNTIEEVILEDVASYEVTDSKIIFHFNKDPDEIVHLVNTVEEMKGEWCFLSLNATRIGLKIDMSK